MHDRQKNAPMCRTEIFEQGDKKVIAKHKLRHIMYIKKGQHIETNIIGKQMTRGQLVKAAAHVLNWQ